MKHPDGDPWFLAQDLLSKKFTRYWAEHETMPRVAAGKEKPLHFVGFAQDRLAVGGHVVKA